MSQHSSAGGAQQQANARALINQFYQRAKAPLPKYDVEASPTDEQPTRFVCNLTLACATVEGITFDEQTFQAEGRSKKQAQDAAAELACRFLLEQPAYSASKPYDASLELTMARVLSPDVRPYAPERMQPELRLYEQKHWGLRRDPDTMSHVLLARRHTAGALPLVVLAHNRVVRAWAKEHGPKGVAPNDVAALTALVQARLAAAAAAAAPAEPESSSSNSLAAVAAAPAGGESVSNGEAAATATALSAVEPQPAAQQQSTSQYAVIKQPPQPPPPPPQQQQQLQLGPDGYSLQLAPVAEQEAQSSRTTLEDVLVGIDAHTRRAAVVLLPADGSPVRELSVPAEGFLLGHVAAVLGCATPQHVMQWGRVGQHVNYVADPAVAAAAAAAAAAATAAGAASTTAAAAHAGGVHAHAEPSPAAGAGPQGEPPAAACAGGGGSAAVPAAAAALPPPYRADSTRSLIAQRGPAAMDWSADREEVRGPEHPPVVHHATGGGAAAALASQRAGGGAAGAGAEGGSEQQHGNHVIKVPEPSMLSALLPQLRGQGLVSGPTAADAAAAVAAPAAPVLNVRATWMAGQRVYGDAVLTLCRASPDQTGRHMMKWRNFGEADWWRAAAALFPAAKFGKTLHAPMLLRLPTVLRSASSWHGQLPRLLLDSYVTANPHTAAVSYVYDVPDVDLPGEGTVTLRATSFCGEAVEVTEGPGDLEACAQCAALAALHMLQALDARALTRGSVLGTEAEGDDGGAMTTTTRAATMEGDLAPAGPLAAASLDAENTSVSRGPGAARGASVGISAAGGDEESIILDGGAGGAAGPGGAPGDAGGGGGFSRSHSMASVRSAATARSFAPPSAANNNNSDLLVSERSAASSLTMRPPPVPPPQRRRGSAAAADAASQQQQGVSLLGENEVSEGAWAEAHGIEVLVQGQEHGRRPRPGLIAKLSYVLWLPCSEEEAPGGRYVLERTVAGHHVTLTLGCGGAAEEVEAAIMRLLPGGEATCRTTVALEGVDPLHRFPRYTATLELKLLRVSLPGIDRPAGQSAAAARGALPELFSPTLGQQRLEAVAAALRRGGATQLVDLGCGEGKLLEGLITDRQGVDCGGPLRSLVGVDISAKALAGAARRLAKLQADANSDGGNGAATAVLYSGSAASEAILQQAAPGTAGQAGAEGDPWVSLRGCDAAALIEVVEHLDPEPLGLVGPCVLGALRPRLLLVTTPNWEYNAAIRAAEGAKGDGGGAGWPGPPGRDGLPLRCNDHRFEWTRAEFQDWAKGLAAQWGYGVSFEGIGKLVNERQAMVKLGLAAEELDERLTPGPDLGHATQMAVFTLMQAGAPDGGGGGGRTATVAAANAGSGSGWQRVWGPAAVAAPPLAGDDEGSVAGAEADAGRSATAAGAAAQAAEAAEGSKQQRTKRRSSGTSEAAGANASAGGAAGAVVQGSAGSAAVAGSSAELQQLDAATANDDSLLLPLKRQALEPAESSQDAQMAGAGAARYGTCTAAVMMGSERQSSAASGGAGVVGSSSIDAFMMGAAPAAGSVVDETF